MNQEKEIKTIVDRFDCLKELEKDNIVEYAIRTHAKPTQKGWIVRAELWSFECNNTEKEVLIATAHQEKWFDESGQSALAIAETQAISRLIGIFLREGNVASKEELDEFTRTLKAEFEKKLNGGMSDRDAKKYMDSLGVDMRIALKKVYAQHQSEKVKNKALGK